MTGNESVICAIVISDWGIGFNSMSAELENAMQDLITAKQFDALSNE